MEKMYICLCDSNCGSVKRGSKWLTVSTVLPAFPLFRLEAVTSAAARSLLLARTARDVTRPPLRPVTWRVHRSLLIKFVLHASCTYIIVLLLAVDACTYAYARMHAGMHTCMQRAHARFYLHGFNVYHSFCHAAFSIELPLFSRRPFYENKTCFLYLSAATAERSREIGNRHRSARRIP